MLHHGTKEQPNPPGAHIMWEADRNHCRDTVTLLKTSQTYASGTVLGLIIAADKHARFDPAAADGRETAAAVLFGPVDTRNDDQPGVVSARSTTLRGADLVWPAGLTEEQRAAALADLAAHHLVVR